MVSCNSSCGLTIKTLKIAYSWAPHEWCSIKMRQEGKWTIAHKVRIHYRNLIPINNAEKNKLKNISRLIVYVYEHFYWGCCFYWLIAWTLTGWLCKSRPFFTPYLFASFLCSWNASDLWRRDCIFDLMLFVCFFFLPDAREIAFHRIEYKIGMELSFMHEMMWQPWSIDQHVSNISWHCDTECNHLVVI